MFYKMFLKVKNKEYEIEIEDITDKKESGYESYSKGVINKFSKQKSLNKKNIKGKE